MNCTVIVVHLSVCSVLLLQASRDEPNPPYTIFIFTWGSARAENAVLMGSIVSKLAV